MNGLYKAYCLTHMAAKTLLKRYNRNNDYPQAADYRVRLGISAEDSTLLWKRFIYNATIPANETNAGSLYAGYIMEARRWCLPSWIWTSAASVRVLINEDRICLLEDVVHHLVECQTNRGGVDCP